MAGNFIDFKSDNLIELLGPVDRTTGLPVDAGSTATALLFDANKDTYVTELAAALTEDALAAQTVLNVVDTIGFGDLDLVRVDLDDGTVHDTLANSFTATTVTINVGLPSAAAKGLKIRRYALFTNTTHIRVNNTAGWKLDDRCIVSLSGNSTAFHSSKVIQVFDGFLVLNVALTGTCDNGNSVASSIETGNAIALSSFGEPFPTEIADTVEGDPAWGFRGTLPDTSFDIDTGVGGNLGLTLGQRVRIEYTLTLSGGAVMFRKAIATVVNL